MKLNLKSNNANFPPSDVRKPAFSQGHTGGSRIANLKKLKQRQFGEYCFDYIVQCKHNLSSSSFHACPLCKLTQQVTRAFFEKENEQREKARLESNVARARLRRQLIYMWSMCQPSFYPSQYQCDPYFEIIFSDQLLQALNDNQATFDEWFQTQNTMLIKGQMTSGKFNPNLSTHSGVDFSQLIRIIERRIRINDVGHVAATFLQARIRRFLTQVRLRYVLLKRFEYIPETAIRGAIFYDSLKQRKWQRYPNLLANDRPATPRTIKRRINYENQLKDKKLEKYREIVRKRNIELDAKDQDGSPHNSPSKLEADNIQQWWDREERLVHIFEHLVILRDLISVYFHAMRNNGHTGPVWFFPTAPGLHSRSLGLSVALQTLPSPALTIVPSAAPKIAVNEKTKQSAPAVKVSTVTNSSSSGGVLNPTNSSNDGTNTIPTATLNRALFLLEQAARDALCVTTPEEVASLVIRSPELRNVYESVAHITYDGIDEIWNGELSFQPYEPPPDSTSILPPDEQSISSQKKFIDDVSASSQLQNSDDLQSLNSIADSLDTSNIASLLPYGIILRPLNAAFRNNSPDNTSSASNITYTKPSAAQFFRLFYMDEELLGISPCSNWVFYPEIHRFRDNIFNGIRKFSTTSATRNMIRQYYQRHQHYRQRLFLRRQQIVVLKRRLRRLLHLQNAYREFAVNEKAVEEVIISSPNILTMVVSSFAQQSQAQSQSSHHYTPKLGGNQSKAGFSSGINSSNNSVKSKSTSTVNSRDKPPLPGSHTNARSTASHHSNDSEGSSLFAPTPEMIFPPYVDTNRDSYTSPVNLTQSILSLDRSRVNYLQETYGKMAFLRRNAVFQEKLRRTQISNNRAPATNAANASKAGGSVVSTSTAAIHANELMIARRHGLILDHRWKSPHVAAKYDDEMDQKDDDSLSTSHSNQLKTNHKSSNDKTKSNVHGSSDLPPQHPIKAAFALAFADATANSTGLNHSTELSSTQEQKHSTNSSSSPLFLGGDVFRMIQSIPGNNIPIPPAKTTTYSEPPANTVNNPANTNDFFLGEYVKRLYEYSVNVHTCIRDRLEEASSFVRYPDEDILTAGLPLPFFERTHPQKQPQPDMESYIQQLDKEISRLESEAVTALENFELKAIEENSGILSEAARIQKTDRESRLIAALNKIKPHSQGTYGRSSEDEEDREDAEERVRYEETFPSPTLLVLEVYVHLPTRPSQPTGAGAINNGRRNGVSILVAPGSIPVPLPVNTNKTDDNESVGDDNSSVGSGSNMDGSSLDSSVASVTNAATLAAKKRNSMYGFVDPSTGFTPTVTVHQVLGMYSCDDIAKTPEHLDCGLFNFEYFRAIYREKQAVLQLQQPQLWAKRGGGSRGDDGTSSRKSSAAVPGPLTRQQSSTTIKPGSNSLRASAAVNAANVLNPSANLTVDNVTWSKEVNASTGVVVGQVLSQPSHKMECQFLYLAQSPSRDFLEKSLPRKIKLWLGMAAPDKTVSTS